MIQVERADPLSADSQALIEKLSAVLARITGSSGKRSFNIDDLQSARSVWALARNAQGVAIGCGAIRPLTQETAELKRMYSTGSEAGVGSAILCFLEEAARTLGYREVTLETRRVNHKAVAFYEKHGYTVTDNYGVYIGRAEAVCFIKRL
ncbi:MULTISPECIES: GNAT family N-acetyltransferase [Enterobacteriaceae]|jgi:N-acetylglutamate synthase-like GNAT family acetyltransferase|uniref:GNAT family N-acetyltransferase n=1 Tax=Citrobacter bitternis TaxID=1585982 RepID=A0ABW1Q2D1_9ENTR|nr:MULTISPECIES: GNAT family N-acetyltransferase [Phytobacter]MDU7131880.1 GNAT family N-acetyltransferase [Enterobacteriaceae bacterium]PTA97418.1 N-acetyltransferase [Kluyvera sp. Nf5]QIH64704.1 N-acetyltransferase [Enterobacteriaceae bacterium A-F18]MDU4353713.1 GNAT family N-acetyltransferase [Phytobacter diazotrophicus]MDV2901896.1 GNAT family N-acetyltransferase [Phytobacter diazotrophicus]